MRWCYLVFAQLVLVSCSGPLQTTGGIGTGGVCVNGDGGYQMPRRDLVFVVPEGSNTLSYSLGPAVGDGGDVYCLAYRGSGTASDQIALDIKEGLLQRVYSKTIDQTVGIAARVREGIDEVGSGEFANQSVGFDGTTNALRLEVDPFDREAMAFANAALRPYGYCVYLDGSNDPYVPRWSQTLCPQPGAVGQTATGGFGTGAGGKLDSSGLTEAELVGSIQSPSNTGQIDGVLYKPNLTHDLVVLRSQDPGGRGRWKLHTIAPVRLPNAAPKLIARVDRGAFVTRESELVFEDGVLVDAALEKTSEVNAVVDVTIEVFNAIFSIPVQILKVGANEAENRKRLIAANAQLLEETRNYREALESLEATQTQIAQDQATEAQLKKVCEDGIQNEGNDNEEYQKRVESCLEEAKKCDPDDEMCIADAVKVADGL